MWRTVTREGKTVTRDLLCGLRAGTRRMDLEAVRRDQETGTRD